MITEEEYEKTVREIEEQRYYSRLAEESEEKIRKAKQNDKEN